MDIPQELIEQIAMGNGVLFVGAGLSQEAGLPGWPELLRQMMTWAEARGVDMRDQAELESYVAGNELLLVAEEMRDRLGQDDFRRFMAEVFRKPGLKPTDAHKMLPHIPFTAALTSNYDTLLETAYTLVNGAAPHVFTQADYPELSAALRSGEFYVLHVHGTIDRIETVVLGRSDYRQVIHTNRAYRQHLTNLFGSKTVLFLGFGLSDPDLLLLLDELQTTFKGYTGRHFALMPDVPQLKARHLAQDYGIQVISYTLKDQENYSERLLQKLVHDMNSQRVQRHLQRAAEYRQQMNFEKGIYELEEALKLAPEDLDIKKKLADACLERAYQYEKEKEFEEMCNWFDKAKGIYKNLGLSSKIQEAKEGKERAHLRLAKQFLEKGNLEDAKNNLDQVPPSTQGYQEVRRDLDKKRQWSSSHPIRL